MSRFKRMSETVGILTRLAAFAAAADAARLAAFAAAAEAVRLAAFDAARLAAFAAAADAAWLVALDAAEDAPLVAAEEAAEPVLVATEPMPPAFAPGAAPLGGFGLPCEADDSCGATVVCTVELVGSTPPLLPAGATVAMR
jgi:hypothetical protein